MRLAIEIGSLRLYTPLARARFCRVFLSKGAHAKFCAISTTRPPTRSVPATLSEFSLAPVKAKPQVCEWLAWAKLCEAEELRRPRCQKATLNHFYMFGPSEPQFHR
jgi:hypothetical protein